MMPDFDFSFGDDSPPGEKGTIEKFFAKASETMSGCLSTIKSWWTDAKAWFVGLFGEIASNPGDMDLMGKLARAWNAVTEFLSPVKEAFNWMAEKATEVVTSVSKSIVGAFDAVKLASCSEFRDANVDPTFISTDSPLATAKANQGKTKEEVMKEHMKSSPANEELSKVEQQKLIHARALSLIPPNFSEI